MDPLVKKVVDTGISKGVDFNEISSAMYNSGAGENQVLQAQEYYNQIKKKSPSVAGVSPSISGRTPSSLELAPVKVKGQGDPNDPSGLYGQVEEANRRINTANRIYDVLSKKGELSPKEIESARKDYQEYRSFYPNLPIDPSKDVGLLTDNIARDRMNIKAKSQPDESNYRKWMDYIYQSQPGGENGFLTTILRGTEKVAGDIVSLGGAINDATDAFYSSVFGEETAENYKKTFKDTPLEPGAISRFGKGMAEQWNENTKKIASNWDMTEEQYEKGPGEALLEGDFSTAGKGIAIGLLHTMPELIATAIGLRTMKGAALAGEAITANLISKGTPKWIAGAAGRARAMAPTTLPLYTGANYAEVLDDPEFTTGEKILYAVGSAAGSTIAESVGGFGEYFLGGAAKKQAVNQVKSSIMQSIGRGTVDMLKAAGVEGAEEVLDGGIQQALGIALGDKKFDANSLLDGFLIGATMGGGTNLISKSPSLIGLSSDMLTTIKITDELSKIQAALSDPSLSDVERDLLTNRARVANNEIRRAKNSAAIFFQGYTPEDLQETMTLNSEIRRQIDSMPSFKTDEAKSAAIQSVKDSVARLKQIESKYDSQEKQQVQGAVQAGAQPGGIPVEGAGTEATAPGGVLQNVGQTQEEQVAEQRTEQASAFNVRPRLKKMKVTAKNAPGAYKMMMDALSNYTDEFLQQNKTDRTSVERGIKSLFDVISSLDAKGRTVEIDVMGSIDEANKLFGFEINEVDGKFKVSSKIPGANRVFDTKEGADAYTKRVLYRGVNMMSDGGDVKISVLLPAMLDNTGYHEALHSLEVFDDKSADKLVVSLMNAIKKLPVLDGRMIAFMESYRGKPEPERNSEYLAELGSMISSGEISVEIRDSVIKSLTKSFLDFFKNMIGSDVDVTPTAEQLARTFNDIAEKLGRGEKQPPYRKTRKKGEESGAVDRAGTSQPKFQRIFADVIDGLYSPLENNILQSKQDKMPAKQWLDKFARTDEAYWTGLQEWLGTKQGSVSKQEIMDWLKDNRVEIREVVKGGLDGNDTKYSQYQLEGEKENYKELLVALPRKLSIPDGKYIVYADKGSAQAREYIKGFETDKEAFDWIKENEDKYPYTIDFETRKVISEIESGNVFKSTHFDEPNILVHLRMNTRYSQKENENYLDPKTHKPKFDEAFELIDNGDNYQVKKIGSQSPYFNTYDKKVLTDNNMSENDLKEYLMAYNMLGKVHPDFKENKKLVPIKVLLLEEVQSDWGQKGRKEGFEGDKAIELFNQFKYEVIDVDGKKLHTFLSSDGETVISSSEKFENAKKTAEDIARKNAEFLYTREVPKAPFVTDTNAWAKLGLKMALREAVRQNADKLAWTTGEQQNERYDLSNQVDEIKVVNVSKATSGKYKWDITIKKDGDNIGAKQLEDDKGLADYVGKDLAEKIITENPNNLDTKKYAGDNLKVGGKGMKGFYDKIVPDAAKAIVRELTGVQGVIDETKIELSGGDVSTQKSIDITPELKAAVQIGVPKFQRAASDEISMDDFTALSKRLNKFFKGNVKIVDADTFEKESEKFTGEKLDLKSYDGDVYGAVLPNGVMFINGLDVNSLLHEHTHLFNQVVMKVNPRLWSSIKDAVKKTAEWSQVKRNPMYSNLKTDDEIADEVFSKIIGNAAKNGWQKYTNQSIYQNIKALAQKFYNTILDLFGVDYYKGMSASGLADLTLTELMGGVSTTPYQVDAKINELMSKLLKGTKYLNQVRFNIDPNSRKKFEKALGEKDGRALYEIFGNVQDPSKLIDFAKSKFPIKGTLSSVAKRSVKDDNGNVVINGNFGSIVVYKEYEKFLNKELEQVVDKATLDPQDLLNEVGYTLFNPTNLSDARNSFLHYYKSGHNICTLNPSSNRFSGSFVTFIVRNDADQTPSAEDLTQDNLTDEWRKYLEKKGRKNSDGTYNLNGLMPNALDPYSTSVISLQIDKSNGSTKEISRYNHQIGSPDNIFSRDFDNLIEGLSDAMFKKFGVDKNTKQSTAQMPFGVIQDANGVYYNYIYETNGVYYGGGYYLENGVATLLDRGSERMVDGWVISNRGDGTATNIDRTASGYNRYGFFYGDVKKVNYIKGDEISLTTENGNFVFEVKNGAVVKLIEFPKKWRLDKFKEASIRVEYDENRNLILSGLGFARDVRYTNMLWADDIVGISRSVDFIGTRIQYLGNLQYIKGDVSFIDSQIQSLGNRNYIGGYVDFRGSQVKSLGKLKYIGDDAYFRNSQVKSLGELKYIGGKANFFNSQVQSLGELKYIGSYADFNGSQVQSLGELKYIRGDANFIDSQVQSLGNLQFIIGNAYFRNSQIQSLGELKYIGSRVTYSNSPIDSKAIEDIKRKSEESTAEILVRDADEFMTSMNREFEQFGKETEEEATESQPKFQRIATFFSGAGTLEAAMTEPTSVMAVEYTPDYIKAYNEAFNTDYKARDVLDIDPQEVIDSAPDIFHASPTCKSFSKARIGARGAKEMDIKSAESVARVIREARPPVVTIENVPNYKGSLPYDKIISALKDAGYKYDEGIYNAADFGGIQQRRRLIIRAALNVDLPAIPDKKKPVDWFKALEPMIDSAPDSAFTGKGDDENWEVKRLLNMIKSGRLSADKPIITMGGSTDSGVASAANAGGPAPTLTSSSKQVPRIIMPDGRIKRVTPDMMRVLMGLPESYRVPDDWKTAKEVLGNGIDGNITRALIEPLSKKSEEFRESQPKFQTPIDEAFDKSQAILDAMSKRGGIITNLVVRFADRSSSLKKKLIEANLKNARDLFVVQAGAGSRAKFFIDESFSPIYNGLNKENSEYLDKIIQLRRIIQIDEDFDSKGKPRIIHPSDKNGIPLNKERAEANLVDYESMFGSALYNDLINRSDLYFDAYKKLLSIMRDNGLITKELYDNLKSLLYQPRKFLDQFVSFEEGETTLDVKDLALNEAQIKTLQNGSDSEIMMNSKLLLAFSAKSVFSRVARNKTYTAISEAVKDPANDWISNKQLKNFKPVNYFVDGVREQFFIREDYQKQLYDSTRHLISPNVARVMRVLTGSAILKSFATQVNPLFALKNFPRDVLHVAMFTNIYGNNLYPALFRISRDAFRGMHDKMSNSKDFKEWLEYGGGMDFLSTEGFESRSVRVGAFNKIRDAMSTFGEYSEVGVRLAVYKKTKADLTDEFVKTNGRGPNKEESDTIKTQAAVASREIIDFAQGGSWAKAGENIIPYLNASIQGFRVGANYIVKNPKDFAVKFAQLSLAVGVIMFYNSMMADDDEWKKIQDGEKMRNFIIFTPFKDKDGNRYYIKIAKTQQAIAWITFAEMMSAKMLNETLNPDDDEKIADKYKIYGDRTYDALVDGLMTFFPKNPLDLKKEITSAIPAINALAAVNNYDTFINKQVSYDYQKVPAVYEDILDPDIPYFYKALSQSIHPVMEIGPKRLGTAVEKITTGAETSVIVAGAYYLLDNVARKVANLKTDELNLGEVPKGDSELNAISSMFSPLKGVVKKVNPNLKKYQYSEDLDDITLRGASSIKTIKNASRNLGEKYYDALRGQGDLTKDEVLKEVKDYRDMLIEKGVQKSQVESFVNAFKMSAKSSPSESWDAGYYDIMYSPSSDATVEIISKLKGDNLTDAELKEYFISYKKSTGYNIKNMGEVYSLYRKSRDKK